MTRTTAQLAWFMCLVLSGCSCSSSSTAKDAGPDATSGGTGGDGGDETGGDGGSGATSGGDGGQSGSDGGSGRDGGGSGGAGGMNTGGSGDEDAGPDANDDGGTAPEDIPDRFTIVNNTTATLYIDANLIVSCVTGTSDPQASCSFASYDCTPSCETVSSGETCCLQCEQPEPRALRLAPGERHALAWDGRLFTRVTGACVECSCQVSEDIPSGTYRALVRTFADFTCEFGACEFDASDIALGAKPSGSSAEHSAELVIPSDEEELVIEIN